MRLPTTSIALGCAAFIFAPLGLAQANEDKAPTHFSLDPDPQGIYGGTDVAPCGWPTTVSMQGSCTGTLVHPEVVIYAAHCGSGYSAVQFGESINGPTRSVPTDFCRTYPGGGPGGGNDFAFCKLSQPQTDIPIVPPLMGCETSILQSGQEVTIVGYGNADTGPYGIKREVVTTITGVTNEAAIGGGGKDSCQGDSGGPVYVKLPAESGVGSWRVFGITSYGGACGGGGMYSMMHLGMEWFESESGIDITPCHDADGTWNPGVDCFQFPMDPGPGSGNWSGGCAGGPLGAYESVCGAPFNNEPDDTPPVVSITAPTDGSMFESDPLLDGQAQISIAASADDGDGWGVQSVSLIINGNDVPGGDDSSAPYDWNAKFPPGIYEVQARAVDYAGNEATSAKVVFGVDMEPPVNPTTSGSDSDSGTDGGTDASSGTEGWSDTNPFESATGGMDDDKGGCACRSTPDTLPTGAAALVGLMAFLRRRRD